MKKQVKRRLPTIFDMEYVRLRNAITRLPLAERGPVFVKIKELLDAQILARKKNRGVPEVTLTLEPAAELVTEVTGALAPAAAPSKKCKWQPEWDTLLLNAVSLLSAGQNVVVIVAEMDVCV